MLDRSGIWLAVLALALGGCALPGTDTAQSPPQPAAPAAAAPVLPSPAERAAAEAAAMEAAKALLSQAETDVQRARARRALWLKAWEDLVVARQALAASDHRGAARHARRASELARLGLEQLAYPAVR